MLRYGFFLLAVLLGLGQAATAVDEIAVIYNGEPMLAKQVTMGFWGYRPVAEEEANPFQPIRLVANRKIYGLKVLSLGRYSGVRLDFANPLDIDELQKEKNIFVELYLRAPLQATMQLPTVATETTPAVTAPTMETVPRPNRRMRMTPEGEDMPGARGGRFGDENLPIGMEPGDGPAPRVGVQPDAGDFPADLLQEVAKEPNVVPLPPLKNLRFTLVTDKGPGLIVITPEDFYPRDEVNKTWVRIGIPLSKLNKALPVGGKLTRLIITSDEPTEVLIGRIAFIRDNDPISVNMFIFPPFLEAKQRIFFAARVDAGLTPYDVQWDFDTAGGASIDGTGERITYTYAKEGVYTITCTAVDKTGGKPSASTTVEVKISRPWEE